jgi:hypothetical protein
MPRYRMKKRGSSLGLVGEHLDVGEVARCRAMGGTGLSFGGSLQRGGMRCRRTACGRADDAGADLPAAAVPAVDDDVDQQVAGGVLDVDLERPAASPR